MSWPWRRTGASTRGILPCFTEFGAIEQCRRNIGIKTRGMSSSLLKEPSRRVKRMSDTPDKKWSPSHSVPEKGTRAFYEWKARQKTRLKMREEKFFGGKRRFWGLLDSDRRRP